MRKFPCLYLVQNGAQKYLFPTLSLLPELNCPPIIRQLMESFCTSSTEKTSWTRLLFGLWWT